MGSSDTKAHVHNNSLDNSQPLVRELSKEAKPIALRVPSLSPALPVNASSQVPPTCHT